MQEGNTIRVDDELFREIERAVMESQDPRGAVNDLLNQHQNNPSFPDLCEKAHLALAIQRVYELNAGKRIEYWTS